MQISMDFNNLKFKTLSLNVRGIRSFEKRKSIFNWLYKQNSDICFLQETYSTEEIENQWKKQWSGDIYFAHGSNHSRGVAILIRKSFDFKLKSIRSDEDGRYLILETTIQDVPFLLINKRGEFHISHDASRQICLFSPRWKGRSSGFEGDFQRPEFQDAAHPR